VTCPAPCIVAPASVSGWQILKCVRYDDGDIHRISPSLKSATKMKDPAADDNGARG